MRNFLLFLALLVTSFPVNSIAAGSAPPTWVGLERDTPDGRTAWSVQLHRLEGDLVRVELTLDGFHRIPEHGSRFELIQVPGTGTTRVPGLPALPVLQQRLLGSAGATPQILGVEVDTVLVPNVVPAPHTPRPKRCGDEWSARITCDTDWYTSGEAFPETWATVRRGGLLRSIPVVELSFSPFRYHPVTRKLEVARRVTVTLSLAPLDGMDLPTRALVRPFIEEVKRAFLDPFPLLREGPAGAAERLLILAHDDLAPAMDDFVTWKRHTGLDVELVPLSAVGSSWQDVADYLNGQYHDAPVAPTYVLLVGDGEGPTSVPFVPSPLGCASDFLYTTVEGGDLYSDFLIGRFSADAAADAALQAEKVIWYERDLTPSTGTWVPRSICISSSEGSGGSNDDVRSDIICGIQQGAGYETAKLYNSMGNDTAANVSTAINEGLGWVTYLGHGSGTSWSTMTPAYSVNHIAQLDNLDMLPVIMDVSCSNGKFDGGGGDCLAEAWLKTGESGDLRAAIGSYSASTPAAWDEPAEMAIGFAKGLLEEDISRYGEACLFARGYMMDVLPGYGSIEEVCHQYVLFGDPSLRLRTETPWTPEVQIPEVIPVGLPSMEVIVTRDGAPVEGASVVVRKDEEFYTAALTGPDGLAAVAIAPQTPGTAEVWVTAANAATWEGTVQVSATGCGVLLTDLDVAGCEASLTLSLFDQDLNMSAGQTEAVQVLAASSGAPGAPVTITLTEQGTDSGTFIGEFVLTPVLHQGKLVVSHGETVTVVYADADCDGAAAEAAVQVPVDCQAPMISEIVIEDITAGSAQVYFNTDEPAAGMALFGVGAPPTTEAPGSAGTLEHQIFLGPLGPSTTYLVEVQATDLAGNVAVDDADGAYHVFETPYCSPQCDGKQCGDNGCGGVCGTCCSDQSCMDGACEGGAGCEPGDGAGCGGCACEECVCVMDEYCCTGQWDDICVSECIEHCGGCPTVGDCIGKECGDDGCGGSCGECTAPEECVLGQCGTPCVPDCQGKECGSDGCGGDCGDCPVGDTCGEDGICQAPCPDLPAGGCCYGDILVFCDLLVGAEAQADCTKDDLRCGWDPTLDMYNCVETQSADPSGSHPLWCPGTCTPDCAGKDCGDDSCSGSCGSCVPGFTCGEDFTCTLKTGGEDVVEADGGGGSLSGGQARSPTGCGAGPATAPPWYAMMLLAISILVPFFIRKGCSMRNIVLIATLFATAPAAANPGPELTPHPRLPGVLMDAAFVRPLPALLDPVPTATPPFAPETLLPAAPVPENGEVIAEIRHAVRLPAGESIVFRYDPTDGLWTRVSGPGGLVDAAWDAVDAAPAWLRDALAGNLADLPADRQEALADLVTHPADPRHRDELAFLLAHVAPEDLARLQLSADYLADHVARLHAMDAVLDHVELLDTGDPATDDDFYTTARYTTLEEGQEVTFEISREDYYWFVVHPKLDGEELYEISPVTGAFAPAPAGYTFRDYFLEPPESAETYTLHWIFRAQPSYALDAIPPDSLAGWGPSSRGSLTDFAVDPLVLTEDEEGSATTVEFRVSKGTVLATTLEVERAWADGTSDLLENLLRYGPGNVVQNKFQKHLVIQDRAPFGLDGITGEILDAHYVVWDEITSDQIGEIDLSEYRKIIIPSDQPLTLYQALTDHSEVLDAWLKDGWRIIELHLAAPEAADAATGLLLPGGFALAAPEGTCDAPVLGGQPPLAPIIDGAAYVWDGVTYPSLTGDRPLDQDSFIIDRIGWWVSQNMIDNISEWGEKHGLQPERAIQAVRIVFNHFGNCGELQDMITSASRTLLLPVTNVSNSNEDHVWNEFLMDDGWHTLQVSWSDSSTHVDSPAISADDQTGGGKDVSMVSSFRGDGRVHSVSPRYTDTINITVRVEDATGAAMEGVQLLLFSESYYDPSQLGAGLWGLTDETGTWVTEVGEDNSYYVRAYSRFGEEPPDGVAKIIGSAQAFAGADVTATLQMDVTPGAVGPAAILDIPPAADDRWFRVQSRPVRTMRCGFSPYGGLTYCDDVGAGSIDLLVLDEANHTAWAAGEPFDAFSFGDNLAEIDMAAAAPAEGSWYVVFLNQDAHDTRRHLELTFETIGPAHEPDPEPEPDLISEPETDAEFVPDTSEDATVGDTTGTPQPGSGGGSKGCTAGPDSAALPAFLLALAFVGLWRLLWVLWGLRRREQA